MRLHEFNVGDYVTVNDTLNPKIWQDGQLDPKVAAKLIEVGKAFEVFVGVDLPVVDYIITGSNANFMWTKHSDLDVHIVIPGIPDDAARELYTAKKALWGDKHDIRIKGLPVECYVQGAAEPHHSTGIYSLTKQTWLVKPKKTKPRINDRAIAAKKEALEHDVEVALGLRNLERLKHVKDRITTMRKAGLERAGEWSTENLVFKILRSLGLIEQLSELILELEDEELSLEMSKPLT